MKLDDMLNQQKNRGMKQVKIKAQMQSYDEYVKDDLSPRPYNTPNVTDLALPMEPLIVEASKTIDAKPNNINLSFKDTNKNVLPGNTQYKDLAGNEKRIIDEIAYQCVMKNDDQTDFMDKKQFSQRTSVKLGAIKTSVRRLKEKGIIISYEASKGRHSSWKFTLSSEILQQYKFSKT